MSKTLSQTEWHWSERVKFAQSNCILDGISLSAVLLCYTKVNELSLFKTTELAQSNCMEYPYLQCYNVSLKCMSETCSRQLHTGWNIHICSAIMLHQSVWAKLTQSNCILDGISFSTVLLCYTVSLCYTKAYEQSLLRATAYWMKYPFLQSYFATLKCKNEACSEQLHIGQNIHFYSAITLH